MTMLELANTMPAQATTLDDNDEVTPAPVQGDVIGYMDEEAELTETCPDFEYSEHPIDDHFLARVEAFAINRANRILTEKWGKAHMTAYLGLPIVRVQRWICRQSKVADNTPHPVGTSVLHWLTVLAKYAPDFETAKRALTQAYFDSRRHERIYMFRQYPECEYQAAFPPYLTVEDIYNAIQLIQPETYLDYLGEPTDAPKLRPKVPPSVGRGLFWDIPRVAYIIALKEPDPVYLNGPFLGYRILPSPCQACVTHGYVQNVVCPSYVRRRDRDAVRYLVDFGHSHDEDVLLMTARHFRERQSQPKLPSGYRSWTQYARAVVHATEFAFHVNSSFLVMPTPCNDTPPSPVIDNAVFLKYRYRCILTTRNSNGVARRACRGPLIYALIKNITTKISKKQKKEQRRKEKRARRNH
ncbi:hypothetical protein Dda_0373 [Drechslerella dactyloides]|uniref:Uncharacterized protein n=1 Tax=Drechslerella dactyloides TaxID=74499 RepID=A0AAD6J4U5_DREDA|nr:hypothetical protein Dda_0373 [Drechslerella dactyloides]